jgi:hypothetical protein
MAQSCILDCPHLRQSLLAQDCKFMLLLRKIRALIWIKSPAVARPPLNPLRGAFPPAPA